MTDKTVPAETVERPDLAPEEAEEKATLIDRAKLVQILSRGRSNSRVQEILAQLPADRVGCLVRETDSDVRHYQQLGYKVETGLQGFHGVGDDKVRVGDCILMSTSIENWEAIRSVEADLVSEKLDLARQEYGNLATSNPAVVPFDETTRS